MGDVNRLILASGVLVVSTGVILTAQRGGKYTTVLIGGYVYILALSILDMFGGRLSQLATALAMIAALYVLIDVFPWSVLISFLRGGK